jgi:hypothetical protein
MSTGGNNNNPGYLTAKNTLTTEGGGGSIFSGGKHSSEAATRLNSEVMSPQGIMSPVSSAAQIKIRMSSGHNNNKR